MLASVGASRRNKDRRVVDRTAAPLGSDAMSDMMASGTPVLPCARLLLANLMQAPDAS